MNQINIEVSLKDIVWRLEHPNEVSDTIDFLTMMWIDEYINLWRGFLNSPAKTISEYLETINE